MVPYLAKMFTSVVVGRRTKQVTCEKCGTPFLYELTRTATGTGEAPYFLGQASAKASAQASAQWYLDRRLAHEVELVPCPKCGWVNADMVKTYRKRKYRYLPLLAVVIVVVGFFVALFLGAALARVFGANSDLPWVTRLIVLIFCLASPIWIFPFRFWLRRRIDPNRTYPQRPAVPLGTPPAQIERTDPHTGKTHLAPVPNRYENPDLLAGWAVFRPSQVVFPRVCCCCMAPASTEYSPPFKVNKGSNVPVPLCGPCASRIRRRWWPVALAVAVVLIALVALLARGIPGIDHTGQWIVFGVVSLFAVPFGVAVLPDLICRPYRRRVVDADRGIVRFRATNRAFTGLLMDQVRQSNGDM